MTKKKGSDFPMTEREIARILKIDHTTVHDDIVSGLRKLREVVRKNPELAEKLWMFLEEDVDKVYRPGLKYIMEDETE